MVSTLNRPFVQKSLFKSQPKPKLKPAPKPKSTPAPKPLDEKLVVQLKVDENENIKVQLSAFSETLSAKEVIDGLLDTSKAVRAKGHMSQSTTLLTELGIKRSWSSAHLYQVRHSQKHGSIKMISSIGVSHGANGELDGLCLDPYSHESVKLYLNAVKSVDTNLTQGRGYLKAGLTILDSVHSKLVSPKHA